MIYTGIGSRDTPKEINLLFENIGKYCSHIGYTLRSGHAEGADLSFEKGNDINFGNKEIYIPWKNFNNSKSDLYNIHDKAYEELSKVRKLEYLKPATKKLLARDFMQIMGYNMDTPSNFVVCYCIVENNKPKGGTSIVYNFAKNNNIPIFNVYEYNNLKGFKIDLYNFINNF